MLQEANAAVARIMQLACALDGVISASTALASPSSEFLTDDEIAPFQRYKNKVDPEGGFNKGVASGGDLRYAYTPSLVRPAWRESLILEASDIGGFRLVKIVCVAANANRCARRTCRAPTCSTARATKFSPPACWSKPSSYEEQTRRGVSLKHLTN